MCRLLLPKDEIQHIKYFTAEVHARPNDPEKPQRQQIYWRALRTIPNLEIIKGSFLSQISWRANTGLLLAPPPGGIAVVEGTQGTFL